MVALDVGSSTATTRFHHIRVEGSLNQELDGFTIGSSFGHEVTFCLLKGANEFAANNLALGFRVAHASEGVQELLAHVHGHQTNTGRLDVVFFNLAALVLAQ